MPKRIGETPPWLCRPSPGARIFSDPSAQTPTSPSKRTSLIAPQSTDYFGPRRLIAQRGTEIFVAIGNKVRWADFAKTKDLWEEERTPTHDDPLPYRTLALSTHYPIRQLLISPSEHFLAVCTDHTILIVSLPDHARLSETSQSPVKCSARTLGPATHVLPGSPLASVVWHPLAWSTASTDCLVTVSAAAAVRVWELDRANLMSFDRPALAIDLRKLADGVSSEQDFEPPKFGASKAFTVDDFDMEVAAACFGGTGADDENSWASMTLWTAMKNGDVYALCPLLPSRWRPTATTVPALATSAVSSMASIATEDASIDERRAAEQQYEWVSEIDNEEPLSYLPTETEPETRLRPQNPSAIPRLQGPFELGLNEEDDVEVTDVHIFAPRLDEDQLYSGEEDYDERTNGTLPYTTVIVACSDGRVHVALDLDGVSGQWLPKKGKSTFAVPITDSKDLIPLATLGLPTSGEVFVSFTPDLIQRHTIFTTVGSRVYSVSFDDWMARMGSELTDAAEANDRLLTRLDTICRSQVAVLDSIIDNKEPASDPLSAPAIIDDLDLGYLAITTSSTSAHCATFDQAHLRSMLLRESTSLGVSQSLSRQLANTSITDADNHADVPPSRAVYAPSRVFDMTAEYSITQLKQRLPPQQKRILTEQPMRLSPAMLDVMTSAHRTVSSYTADLETAASELFRRCERLREELGEQVKQMSDLADRLHHIKQQADGEDVRPGEEKLTHDKRLEIVRNKQKDLRHRFEELRRKAGKASSSKKELSKKEIAWVEEIETLNHKVGDKEAAEQEKDALLARFETVSPYSCITYYPPYSN